MKFKFLSAMLIIAITLCIFSCGNNNTKSDNESDKSQNNQIYLSDATFKVENSIYNEPTIYVDKKIYTGILWSNDGRTMSLEVQNGKIEVFKVFHINGKIANIQYGPNSPSSSFDENGNMIEERELDEKYPHLRDATLRIIQKEILPQIIQTYTQDYPKVE